MEECIKDFLFDNWDYGFVVRGLGNDLYLRGEEVVTLLQDNENVEIDLLLDDILYILVGGIPCSVEPNWKWGRFSPNTYLEKRYEVWYINIKRWD